MVFTLSKEKLLSARPQAKIFLAVSCLLLEKMMIFLEFLTILNDFYYDSSTKKFENLLFLRSANCEFLTTSIFLTEHPNKKIGVIIWRGLGWAEWGCLPPLPPPICVLQCILVMTRWHLYNGRAKIQAKPINFHLKSDLIVANDIARPLISLWPL